MSRTRLGSYESAVPANNFTTVPRSRLTSSSLTSSSIEEEGTADTERVELLRTESYNINRSLGNPSSSLGPQTRSPQRSPKRSPQTISIEVLPQKESFHMTRELPHVADNPSKENPSKENPNPRSLGPKTLTLVDKSSPAEIARSRSRRGSLSRFHITLISWHTLCGRAICRRTRRFLCSPAAWISNAYMALMVAIWQLLISWTFKGGLQPERFGFGAMYVLSQPHTAILALVWWGSSGIRTTTPRRYILLAVAAMMLLQIVLGMIVWSCEGSVLTMKLSSYGSFNPYRKAVQVLYEASFVMPFYTFTLGIYTFNPKPTWFFVANLVYIFAWPFYSTVRYFVPAIPGYTTSEVVFLNKGVSSCICIAIVALSWFISMQPKDDPHKPVVVHVKPSSAALASQAEPEPKPDASLSPDREASSVVVPLSQVGALQRGASAEGEATGVSEEEEEEATVQGPESETQALSAHSADPGGAQVVGSKCACKDWIWQHPRVGNTLYVALCFGFFTLMPYTLNFLLQYILKAANKFIDEELDLDNFWAAILAGFIRVSPLLFYKAGVAFVCMAFEQIVGESFVNPVNSLMLAFGLRFAFEIFTKLFYLSLVPFGWTWWLAVVFDLAFSLVSLSGLMEQLRLKLISSCRRHCGRAIKNPLCTTLLKVLRASASLEGSRLYRRNRVRHWPASDKRELRLIFHFLVVVARLGMELLVSTVMVTALAVEFMVVEGSRALQPEEPVYYLWNYHSNASVADRKISFTELPMTEGVAQVLVFLSFCVLLVFEFMGAFGVLLMQHTQQMQLHITNSKCHKAAKIRAKVTRKLIKAKFATLHRAHINKVQLYDEINVLYLRYLLLRMKAGRWETYVVFWRIFKSRLPTYLYIFGFAAIAGMSQSAHLRFTLIILPALMNATGTELESLYLQTNSSGFCDLDNFTYEYSY